MWRLLYRSMDVVIVELRESSSFNGIQIYSYTTEAGKVGCCPVAETTLEKLP